MSLLLAVCKPEVVLAAVLLITSVGASAQTVIEPPPRPASAEVAPDYLVLKKIEIERKGKARYDFDIQLAGDIPNRTGAGFAIYFDLANVELKTPYFNLDGFSPDMYINIFRGGLDKEFDVRIHEIQFTNGQVLSLNIANFAIRKNRISFSVSCDAFKKDVPTRVGFYSGGVKQSRKDYIERAGDYGHFTQAYFLNPESEKNWSATKSAPVPDSLEKFNEGIDSSIIKR